MSKRVLGYLDGGPADGTLIEIDEPHWAPLGTLTLDLGGGRQAVYVLARQRRPPAGTAWRYVPEGSPDAAIQEEDGRSSGNSDPFDD
ncbi:MAG: hypothetical protein JNL54_20975 [Kineosporiaceae bacterium]|nr:hypothetical protein [Kineosporiaceae bacterium]